MESFIKPFRKLFSARTKTLGCAFRNPRSNHSESIRLWQLSADCLRLMLVAASLCALNLRHLGNLMYENTGATVGL